ncbi:MAG: hypothetical protein KJ578_06485 [Bacteroidetes bacterium]|nr:hypothetical protein [Bacteroidota bacterium]
MLVLGFLISPGILTAQKLTLRLQPALSIPLGDFAAKNLDKGSFATAGFSGGGSLQWHLNTTWSINLQAAATWHAIDIGELGYKKVQQDPFLEDVYIRSEAFKNRMLLAGPVYTILLRDKISINNSVAAGLMQSATPYQLYKPQYFMTGPNYYEITSARDYNFVWGVSTALMYHFNTCYQLGFSAEWLHGNPVFTFTTANGLRFDERKISMLNLAMVFSVSLF